MAAVTPTNRVQWSNLESNAMKDLIVRTGLLSAAYADGSRSALRVLDLEKALPLLHGRDLQSGEAKAETVRTARESAMLQKGWTEASAEVSSPWVSASVKYKEEAEKGHTSKEEHVYTTATYRIPTYRVQLTDHDAASLLSDDFLNEVKKAVDDTNPLKALQHVFENYGYLLQLSVDLGASITMSTIQNNTKEIDEQKTKTSLETEVNAKFGAFSAGGSFGKGNETESKDMVENQVGSVMVKVHGGDTTLLTDTKEWLKTTKNLELLTVIGTYSVATITDLIALRDKGLYERVQMALGQPLIGKWVRLPRQGIRVVDSNLTQAPSPAFLPFAPLYMLDPKIMNTLDQIRMTTIEVELPANIAEDGWYLAGDTQLANFGFALLVQDAPGHSGGLGLCTFKSANAFKIEMNPSGAGSAEVNVYRATPDHDGYISIGASFARPSSSKSLGPPDNFRAIRQDLLAPATLVYKSFAFLGGSVGWVITPQDSNEGMETGFFWPANSDVRRDDMLKRQDLPLFVIKRSAIRMQNTLEDVIREYELIEERSTIEVSV